MTSLFRLALAVLAAITCCVAGWASLQALGVPDRPRAAGPAHVGAPPAIVPAVPAPLPPPARVPQVAEASSARASAKTGRVVVALAGALPPFPIALQVRSGWSGAPLLTRELQATGPDGARVSLDDLPLGEHDALLVPADPSHPRSYLARARIVAAAPEGPAVELDARVVDLVVRVSGPGGRPLVRVPVILERVDDAAWQPPTPDGMAWTDAQGDATFARLGAGTYAAHTADGRSTAVRVTLPRDTTATLLAER